LIARTRMLRALAAEAHSRTSEIIIETQHLCGIVRERVAARCGSAAECTAAQPQGAVISRNSRLQSTLVPSPCGAQAPWHRW
jgi:hypothetical protein